MQHRSALVGSQNRPAWDSQRRGTPRGCIAQAVAHPQKSSRRRVVIRRAVLSHHRAYRSVHGGSLNKHASFAMHAGAFDRGHPRNAGRSRLLSAFRAYHRRAAPGLEESGLSVLRRTQGDLPSTDTVKGSALPRGGHAVGTMASADFSRRVLLRTGKFRRPCVRETSQGKERLFPSTYLPHLRCGLPHSNRASACAAASPARLRLMRFLFVRPEVCLLLPSDSTSRWTPLQSAVHFPL